MCGSITSRRCSSKSGKTDTALTWHHSWVLVYPVDFDEQSLEHTGRNKLQTDSG